MARKVLASLLLVSFLLAAGGCLVVAHKDISESGTVVTSSTLDQIVLGETTEAWLIATLGEPNDRTAVQGAENIAILKYRHMVDRENEGAVFLLFSGSSRSKRQSTTYFEIVNGVVNRYWIERARL
ncbi:MAG: hypothetical protein JSV91_01310 [Phycisphaerales bacterium]|nr:MAG: hypothetical protein JSV91_01310 [Phycisphaerales bacterium]